MPTENRSNTEMLSVPRELLERIDRMYTDGMSVYGECEEIRVILADQHQGEPVAVVDEGDDGLFVDFIYGENGNPLQRGDKLYTHADAGEVERLRAQLAEANTAAEQLLQSRDIAQEQVRIREAKLAERDTLLADACALARFTLPDAWHARYAALSASAEPQVKS